MTRIFIVFYLVIGVTFIFVMIQLHITSAQLHLKAEEIYQATLHRVCPKQPTLPNCKDLDRTSSTDAYERWVVKLSVF